MAKRTLKAYEVLVDFDWGFGIGVVAAYGPKAAAKLVQNDSVCNRADGRVTSSTLLTTLVPTVTKPEILVWGDHIE